MNLTFGDINIPVKSGALISVLLMIPNVAWILSSKADAGEQGSTPLVLTILENIGRGAVLLLPLCYSLDLNKKNSTLVMIGMWLALVIYYAAWARYFVSGRSVELFRTPLLGIPLPMAVAPTIFLILSSYLISSWLMLGAAILFGVVHIWVSAINI